MDKTTRENWEKIKKHLEKIGETNNLYYRRACALLAGMPDLI
jgi:GH15 family glucan-1,4-alpha-glucosidase